MGLLQGGDADHGLPSSRVLSREVAGENPQGLAGVPAQVADAHPRICTASAGGKTQRGGCVGRDAGGVGEDGAAPGVT